MAVYTAPTMSFIDTYINAARDNTTRADQRRKDWFEGLTNLGKAGVDSYKFQKRKEILDRAEKLDRREKEIMAELERLKGERDSEAQGNIQAIMQNTDWRGIPDPYKPEADEFEAPRGVVGIYRKELL